MTNAELEEKSARERAELIAQWSEDRAEYAYVVGLCKQWVKNVVALALPEGWWIELEDLPAAASLHTVLRQAGRDPLAEAFEFSVVVKEGTPPREVPIVLHALATACGQLYVEAGPDGLDWLGPLVCHADPRHWDEFFDAAVAAAKDSEPRKAKIVAYARMILSRIQTQPESMLRQSRAHQDVRSEIDQYLAGSTFKNVWDSPDYVMELHHLDVFLLVSRIDEDSFHAILDALPHPGLVRQCLLSHKGSSGVRSLARMLPRLTHSFDPQGNWRASGQAATVVLSLASGALLLAGDPPREFDGTAVDLESWQAAVVAEELKASEELTRALVDALFARADSQYLGWLWLVEILKYAAPAAARSTRTRLVNKPFVLAQAIVERLRSRADALEWVQEPPPGERQNRVAAVLWVASSVAEFDRGVFELLATDLVKRSQQSLGNVEALLMSQAAVFTRGLGRALSRNPDVGGWLLRCWQAIRFQRELAWRSRGTTDGANPAEVVLIYGVSTLAFLISERPQDRAAILSTWDAVEQIVREGRLVERSYEGDDWTHAIEWLFARCPTASQHAAEVTAAASASTAVTETTSPSELAMAISPYVGIDNDFMAIVSGLLDCGLGFDSIAAACAELGADLDVCLRTFVATRRTPVRPGTSRYLARAASLIRGR
jgi:hypothetical protein